MNWRRLFLRFVGRLDRKPHWSGALVLIAVLAAVRLIGGTVLYAITSVLILYPELALGAKCLHDCNKPATWLLSFVVLPNGLLALAGMINDGFVSDLLHLAIADLCAWAVVELGCLRVTVGLNRYGPDPLIVSTVSGV